MMQSRVNNLIFFKCLFVFKVSLAYSLLKLGKRFKILIMISSKELMNEKGSNQCMYIRVNSIHLIEFLNEKN